MNTVNSCTGATYTLDYGDGTIPSQVVVPAGKCAQMTQTLGHTYVYGGVYQITLSAGAHRTSANVQVFGPGAPSSGTPAPAPSSDSLSATPTSGTAPLSVKFIGTINASASCNGGVYLLAFGDGQSTEIPYPADGCKAFTFEVTHSYTSGGTFAANLYRGSSASDSSVDQETITVSGGAGSWGIVSVTPAVGGNPFAISVQIEYPACSAYSIDWGDSALPASVAATSGCSGGTSNATLDHTYSGGGSYTVSLRDGSGVVKTTAAVTISS